MHHDVDLTEVEALMAVAVGGFRRAESVYFKRKLTHGVAPDADILAYHILGAAGELAVARVLGRYWGGDIGSFKKADLGQSVQVRTRSKHEYDLIVRHDDNPDDAYVLVTGTHTRLRVHGWIYGSEARKDEWVQTHAGRPPAWFVPKSALRPLKKKE
jgi:hypothetical protein